MSKDNKEKYDAYGHLRKNMEEKQLQKGVTSSGTPKIVQVFIAVSYTHLTLPTKRIV